MECRIFASKRENGQRRPSLVTRREPRNDVGDMRRALSFAIAAALAAAVACGDSEEDAAEDEPTIGPQDVPAGPAGSGLSTGLPCGVQALVENRCIACHSGNTAGAPRLLEYADFVVPSKADATKTLAQASLTRMRSTTSPMPPPPAVPPEADEINTFETWIILGTPRSREACTDAPPPSRPPGSTPPVVANCTTGKPWTGGNAGSPLMHPGAACNACHQVLGGPNLKIAGTVYATPQPDDCSGAAPPPALTVTVTDSKQNVLSLPVNAAGNFSIERVTGGKLTPPFKASVSDGTKTRAMMGSVTSGDCNSCHTVAGLNGAPGRILAP
jgi:cytochrome c5